MNNKSLRSAAFLGALTVVIGAFGAHGLKPLLTEYQADIFEKGVQYQFYHVFALLGASLLSELLGDNLWLKWSRRLFWTGIALFSGSLYLLACRDIISVPVGWVGPVTPLGGLCFMAGWLCLGLGAQRNQHGTTGT